MKKRLLNFLLIIFASFFLQNCDNDSDNQLIDESLIAAQLTGEIISKEDIGKKSPNILSIVNDLKYNKEGSLVSKSEAFEIIDEHAKYLQYGDYESYTFPIQREASEFSGLENLLISKQKDGSYKPILVVYNVDALEMEQLQNGENIDLTGKIGFKTIDFDIDEVITSKSDLEDAINSCPDGACCNIEKQESQATGWDIWVAVIVDCPETIDAGDSASGGGTSSGNSGNSGGGTSNNPSEGTPNSPSGGTPSGEPGSPSSGGEPGDLCADCLGDFTSPVPIPASIILMNELGISYSTVEGRWLDSHVTISGRLRSYLWENGYSLASINTVNAIIDVLKTTSTPSEEQLEEVKDLLIEEEPLLGQTTRAQLTNEIKRANNYIRTHGYPEEAKYIDEVIDTLDDFSNNELYDFYTTMWNFKIEVKKTFVVAIITPYVETMQIFVEFALFEVGGALAIKLLTKLPSLIKSAETLQVVERLRITTSLAQFKYAEKFGFKSYNAHVNFFNKLKIKRSELGVQVHHLIERRFAPNLGVSEGSMQSIVLTVEEHAVFTQAWKNQIPRNGTLGANVTTATATRAQIEAAAKEIYKNYPDILNALGL